MNSFVSRILKLRSPLWNLFLSTAGCFVFMRGYGLVATVKEGPDTVASIRAAVTSSQPLPKIDALASL
jgi:hypothetical protein